MPNAPTFQCRDSLHLAEGPDMPKFGASGSPEAENVARCSMKGPLCAPYARFRMSKFFTLLGACVYESDSSEGQLYERHTFLLLRRNSCY